VSVFVAAGFEALGAVSKAGPAPFRTNRDGMALGEGAALVALERRASAASLGKILGFGASCDAVHVTAPDRTGRGLARAARRALDEAGNPPIDLVSAHATATPFNDAAEALAISAALGSSAKNAVVHCFKACAGHTLGAAGVLESLAALDAIERGVLTATAGSGPVEPALEARLLEVNTAGRVRAALKLSAAFGGANAALVLAGARADQNARPSLSRPVAVLELGAEVHERDDAALLRTSLSESQRARLDSVSELVVSACEPVSGRLAGFDLERVGVIVASAAATLEANCHFDARRRSRGARSVEPRRFPATSPNLAAGLAAIAFGLEGPAFAVGAGLAAATEGLLVAADLVSVGDADAVLVIAVEDAGPVVRAVWSAAGWPVPMRSARAALLGVGAGLDRGALSRAHSAASVADGVLGVSRPGVGLLAAAIRAAAKIPVIGLEPE
jgi:3-oxoacyl-[acyl-carrier-protein] synthase-1/3-oxoacyl-[acyl-carrier-protein] synthase II